MINLDFFNNNHGQLGDIEITDFLLESNEEEGVMTTPSMERVVCCSWVKSPHLVPIILKSTAVVLSYITQYPYIKAARGATKNPVLKELYGIGEVSTWGSFYAITSLYVIDRIYFDKNQKTLNTKAKVYATAYWLFVALFSVGAQIPDMYITYHYTSGSIFWPVYVGTIYCSFTMNSIDLACQKIAKTDNVISRFLYRNTNKCEIFRARDNFNELLRTYFVSFLRESKDSHLKTLLFQTLNEKSAESEYAKALLFMISKGLETRMEVIKKQNLYIERAGKIIEITGAIVFLGRYYLEGKLSYEASRLIVKSDYFAAFLIVYSLLPNAYLGLSNASTTLGDFALGTLRFLRACWNKNAREYFDKRLTVQAIGYTCATLMAYFGLGSTFKVVEDNVDFEGDELLKGIIISFTAFLAINTTTTMFDMIANKVSQKIGSQDSRTLYSIQDHINTLTERLETMSSEDFTSFLTHLEGELDSKQDLLDDLATSSQFEPLRRALVNSKIMDPFIRTIED